MKKFISLTTFCVFAYSLFAQRTTDEQPYGLRAGIKFLPQDNVVLIVPDMDRIEKEDRENDKKPGPVSFAYPILVNFTPENSGVWHILNDGSKIWRLKVKAPDALATTTTYDKFWLPEGAKFFVYSEETQQYIGAIISEYIGGNNEKPIEFATALIYGEYIVYEYYQPSTVTQSPVISINCIYYGYRYVDPFRDINTGSRDFGDAVDCHRNINCPEGHNWYYEKHAVVKISIPRANGGRMAWCSGALVNNTNNDYTPYVLTADHCLTNAAGSQIYDARFFDNINGVQGNMPGTIFYWQYEHPSCDNVPIPPTPRASTGARVLANSGISSSNNTNTDFALLLVDSLQDPRYITGVYPYYLGWDYSGNIETEDGIGIHHPAGDVKKISNIANIENDPLPMYAGNQIIPANTLWRVIVTTGGIEGGSSGSPLINSNGKLIGILSSAGGTCAPITARYGKLNVAWEGRIPPSQYGPIRRLDHWLDPIGLDPIILNGIGLVPPPPIISGANQIPCKASETYSSGAQPGTPISWTTTGPLIANPSGITTTVTRIGTGSGTLTAMNSNNHAFYTKTFPSCSAPLITYSTSPSSGTTTVDNGCGNITLQNLTVNNNVTLNIISCGIITVNNVIVHNGGRLMLDGGEVVINDVDVRLGADFEIR